MGRRRGLARAAVGVVLAVGVHATSVAAPEWRSLTDGFGWPPCSTVPFTIDADSLPADVPLAVLRADLTDAAAIVNAEIGRPMVTIAAATTTTDPDGSDGVNVVHFTDLVPGDDPHTITINGYVAASWVEYGDGIGEIVDTDVLLDGDDWGEAPRDMRVGTLVHEFGHALGLDHVGDAHEVMSYAYRDDGDGLGPGTRQALRDLYAGTGCGSLKRLVDSHDWSGLSPDRPRAVGLRAGEGPTDVRSLAIEMGQRLGAQRGGGSGWATHAVVCREDLFADCLAGAALAGTSAPLVFVPGGAGGTLSTSDPTYTFLESAVPSGAPVFVLGGPAAVSESIVDTLGARWSATQRLAGSGRFETAIEVARRVVARNGATGTALLARADNPADAVTGGAVAAAKGLPIVLTPSDHLYAPTRDALAELGVTRTVVLGGEAALAPGVVTSLGQHGHGPIRVAGRSRTETAVAIARHPQLWGRTAITDGAAFVGLNGYHEQTWAVALASSPLAALVDAPLLLTGPADVPYVPPADGYPGDTGWYLAHLDGGTSAQLLFVGAGRWADPHARDACWEYLGLY